MKTENRRPTFKRLAQVLLSACLAGLVLAPSVAVGDLNGDAKPDLAVANGSNKVSVLLGTGGGAFAAPADYGTPSPEKRTTAAANTGREQP
jgi:hypothetical protein